MLVTCHLSLVTCCLLLLTSCLLNVIPLFSQMLKIECPFSLVSCKVQSQSMSHIWMLSVTCHLLLVACRMSLVTYYHKVWWNICCNHFYHVISLFKTLFTSFNLISPFSTIFKWQNRFFQKFAWVRYNISFIYAILALFKHFWGFCWPKTEHKSHISLQFLLFCSKVGTQKF